MADARDILIIGHNYAPELIGIAPCTTGMAEHLVESGHRIRVICGKPHYPSWRTTKDYPAGRSRQNGVNILRLPLYVPRHPRGWRRIAHHVSFALVAALPLLFMMLRRRPDVVIAIAPSITSTIVARIATWLLRVRCWIHVQDFEIDMALATGQLAANRVIRTIERFGLTADRVSSISPRMCDRLIAYGNPPVRVSEFRNWASPAVRPLSHSAYRAEWRIARPHVALYSGNIAAKQGIGLVLEAAQRLSHRRDLMFVICGEGPNRAELTSNAAGCSNIVFHDLQPRDRLPDLLALATVHLLPQIADAADLVLPSKLPNMLASGRPVVATARPGTGLAEEVEGCGLVTPPHDARNFAAAIETLLDDSALYATFASAARQRAAERWDKDTILTSFEQDLRRLAGPARAKAWRAQPAAE